MIKRLSQRLLIQKEKTTEIDTVDADIMLVVNPNPGEILVDFPTTTAGWHEEILVDFPHPGYNQKSADRDDRLISRPAGSVEGEDDVDDDGFLGFPTGGRSKSFACREGGASTTCREAASRHNYLPTSIGIPTIDVVTTTGPPHQQLKRTQWLEDDENGNHFEKPLNWFGGSGLEKDESLASLQKEDVQKFVDKDKIEFEKPSNWVGDDESSDGDSEEYRRQIIQMTRDRRRALRPSISLTNVYPEGNPERLPARRTSRVARRSSMPAVFVLEPALAANENPFAAGFEFAKAVPVPPKYGRRPSLTNTTYSFEKQAIGRPQTRTRRASMDTFRPKNDFADGLKAFGAKKHDIRHILA